MSSTPTGPDGIIVEVDGPGASPDKVDAVAALELAASYLDLLQAIAHHDEGKLAFVGISITGGSVGVGATATHPAAAIAAGEMATKYIHGEIEPPRKLIGKVNRTAKALRLLPPGQKAVAKVGEWMSPLALPEAGPRLSPEMTLAIRARPRGAGGKDPTIRFESPFEDGSFTLSATVDQVRALGAVMYLPVDIVARVTRNEDGEIVAGVLESALPVGDADARTVLRDWYQRSGGAEWDLIEDIERELKGDDR